MIVLVCFNWSTRVCVWCKLISRICHHRQIYLRFSHSQYNVGRCSNKLQLNINHNVYKIICFCINIYMLKIMRLWINKPMYLYEEGLFSAHPAHCMKVVPFKFRFRTYCFITVVPNALTCEFARPPTVTVMTTKLCVFFKVWTHLRTIFSTFYAGVVTHHKFIWQPNML